MPTEMYASISWETTMLPSSVAMAVPDRAMMMNAVRMGPSSRVMTTMRIEYRRLVWPKRGRMVLAFHDDDRADGQRDQGDDAHGLDTREEDLQHQDAESDLSSGAEKDGLLDAWKRKPRA